MAAEPNADIIIRGASAELRLAVWRRVVRGVAHDLLNLVMPLRSLMTSLPQAGDSQLRAQLAENSAGRMKAIGLTLHRLEASIRDDADEQTGRWPLLREVIRWAVPRGVRIAHQERDDLGNTLAPASATLVFWTTIYCAELLEPDNGEIGIDAGTETLSLRLPGRLHPEASPTAAEAWSALQELASAGLIELQPDPSTGEPVTVSVRVSYADEPADLSRRASA